MEDLNKDCIPDGFVGAVDNTLKPRCPEDVCTTVDVAFIEEMPACDPVCMPRLQASILTVNPDWNVCPSIPEAIEHPPIKSGWGQHDGGIHWWARVGEYDPAGCPDAGRRAYAQVQWESTLDHETHTGFHAEMPIYRNNQIAKMTPQIFVNLARKIAAIGTHMGWLAAKSDVAVPSKFGLGLVVTGVDGAGKNIYGLGITYDGSNIGAPLPLNTVRDAAGVATALELPLALVTATEA